MANVAQASRKDLRDAVVAARKAQPGWADATAYNRGQVLYRIAEMLEGRRAQFAAEVAASEGISATSRRPPGQRRDRPLGLVRRLERQARPGARRGQPGRRPVLQLLRARADRCGRRDRTERRRRCSGWSRWSRRSIVSGNAAVVIASTERPLPAVTLAEVLATSDLPGGVVNVLTGDVAELAPWLASHQDVDALDLAGAGESAPTELERSAADTVKRVLRPDATEPDWTDAPDLSRMTAFLETKTVWHPVGV